jgi:hypothetical protein
MKRITLLLSTLILSCSSDAENLFAGDEFVATPDSGEPNDTSEEHPDRDAASDAEDADATDATEDINTTDAVAECSRKAFTHCRESGVSGPACPEGYHPETWLRDACSVSGTLWLCLPNCGDFTTCQALLGCPEGWELVESFQTEACGTSTPNTATCREVQ